MPAPPHSSGTHMPMAPSSPSSLRASAGNVWCLSHSAAKGARRSCAKARIESRIISCSEVRIIMGSLQHFNAEGGGFAAADAQAGYAALEAVLLERAKQGNDDAGAGSTDWVAQGAGAAVDVDLV